MDPISLTVFVIASLLVYALRPKPKPPAAATLQDINMPTIDQGTPVPVIFGEVWLDNWMVLYYGDLRNTPIKSSGGKK